MAQAAANGWEAVQDAIYKTLSEANFRENLKLMTGMNGEGMQAHHVLPRDFEVRFVKAGIENINHPIYGSWIESSIHLGFSYEYNQDWSSFFDSFENSTPAVEQILSFATELSGKYGFDIYFR
jgi:hypothetical protein